MLFTKSRSVNLLNTDIGIIIIVSCLTAWATKSDDFIEACELRSTRLNNNSCLMFSNSQTKPTLTDSGLCFRFSMKQQSSISPERELSVHFNANHSLSYAWDCLLSEKFTTCHNRSTSIKPEAKEGCMTVSINCGPNYLGGNNQKNNRNQTNKCKMKRNSYSSFPNKYICFDINKTIYGEKSTSKELPKITTRWRQSTSTTSVPSSSTNTSTRSAFSLSKSTCTAGSSTSTSTSGSSTITSTSGSSTSTSTSDVKSINSQKLTVIGGAVIFCLLLITVICVIVCLLQRKKRIADFGQNRAPNTSETCQSQMESSNLVTSSPIVISDQPDVIYSAGYKLNNDVTYPAVKKPNKEVIYSVVNKPKSPESSANSISVGESPIYQRETGIDEDVHVSVQNPEFIMFNNEIYGCESEKQGNVIGLSSEQNNSIYSLATS